MNNHLYDHIENEHRLYYEIELLSIVLPIYNCYWFLNIHASTLILYFVIECVELTDSNRYWGSRKWK